MLGVDATPSSLETNLSATQKQAFIWKD